MGRTHLKVRNFDRFQHYKNRRPPWVKLYNNLTDDYDFGCLSNASKYLAIGMLLLASRTENHIPNDPAWIARELHYDGDPDLKEVERSGFIEVCGCKTCASNSLSPSKASAPLAARKQTALLEGEGEGEKREIGESDDSPPARAREDRDQEQGDELPEHKRNFLACVNQLKKYTDTEIHGGLLLQWAKRIQPEGLEWIYMELADRGMFDELKDPKELKRYLAGCVKNAEKEYAEFEKRVTPAARRHAS